MCSSTPVSYELYFHTPEVNEKGKTSNPQKPTTTATNPKICLHILQTHSFLYHSGGGRRENFKNCMCSKDFQLDKEVKTGHCSLIRRYFFNYFILFYFIDFREVMLLYKAIQYGTLYHIIEAFIKIVGNVEKNLETVCWKGQKMILFCVLVCPSIAIVFLIYVQPLSKNSLDKQNFHIV